MFEGLVVFSGEVCEGWAWVDEYPVVAQWLVFATNYGVSEFNILHIIKTVKVAMLRKSSLNRLIGNMQAMINIANGHNPTIPRQAQTKLKFLPTIEAMLLIEHLQHVGGPFGRKSKYSVGLLRQK